MDFSILNAIYAGFKDPKELLFIDICIFVAIYMYTHTCISFMNLKGLSCYEYMCV